MNLTTSTLLATETSEGEFQFPESRQPAERVFRVAICDSHPAMVEGVRAIVSRTPGFCSGPVATAIPDAVRILRGNDADILVVDGSFGVLDIISLLSHGFQLGASGETHVVVFGVFFSVRERERFLRAGVKGLIRKDASPEIIQDCLRTVAGSGTWIETSPSASFNAQDARLRLLSDRELQVLGLAAQGLTNSAIGAILGISVGTIKLHMKHIFEKTGVRGRTAAVVRYVAENGVQAMHAERFAMHG